ncbi:lipoprotein [Streptomyces gobitricini]|uniref:Lipoprotein n=1 Tax=Streptomyces gobitricini TaxID=68211 RepID=A0ABN3LGJ3_9ACTN
MTLLVTGCGGGAQEGEDKAAKGGGGADSGKPAAKALTAAELQKLVVAQGDVKDHEIKEPGKDDVSEPGALSVAKAECEPVAQVLSALPVGKPAASVQRLVVRESAAAKKGLPSMAELAGMTEKEVEEATIDSLDITKTMTSLWSYDAEGAGQALATLRETGKKCADGFPMTIDGEKQQVTKVIEEKLSVGEDAVAWTVLTKQDGTMGSTKVAVFRQGTTLAGFSSFNIAAVTRGQAFQQPTVVIEAQAAKLG